MKILIIGQTTLHWGRMEFGNIGNYYIIEPFIRELHNVFPQATIKTTLQFSDRFCKDERVQVLPMEMYYSFREDELINAKNELELVDDYLKNQCFNETTPYIDEVMNADLVIDFSGDLWGENANFLGKDRFEVGLYKDMIAQKLGKPTFMLAGSPGPFYDERTKELAKEVFENFELVTNRESISTELLIQDGFNVTKVHDLACPAFLFEQHNVDELSSILRKEGIKNIDKPMVGFIICGWNFIEGPFDKWPRKDSEYDVFAEVIEYITNELDANVCLMSHSNGFPIPPKQFKLIHGRDYPILKQLHKVIVNRGKTDNVFVLDDVYDAWTTKTIIGNFDMLISGRVHAAVAGLSQSVPTAIIDYGHEPKAHKLKGYARVADMEEYLISADNVTAMKEVINNIWESREDIRTKLNKRVPVIKELAKRNFTLLRDSMEGEV